MTGEKDAGTRAKEMLVYGPIGLALYLRDTAPSFLKLFVARGRTEFEQRRRDVGDQLGQARVAGETAAASGGPQVLQVVADGLAAVRQRAEEALQALGVRMGDEDGTPNGDTLDWSANRARADEPESPAATSDAPEAEATSETPVLAIADYDDLSASQVVDRLDGLPRPDLEAIRDYEAVNRARNTILGKIEQLTRGF